MSKAQHWKGQKWTLPIPQTGHDGQSGERCPRRCRLGNREAFSAAGIKEAARGPRAQLQGVLGPEKCVQQEHEQGLGARGQATCGHSVRSLRACCEAQGSETRPNPRSQLGTEGPSWLK